MKYKCWILGLLVVLCVEVTCTTRAQSRSILALAEQYSTALGKFQSQKGRSSIESVLHKGKAVSNELDQMESLNESDFELLKKTMRGFAVNREETLFIAPESKFFVSLAASNGTRADIAYFNLMQKIRPADVWAAYIEQQTDVTGCTKYDGSLTRLYAEILHFRRTYPNAYIRDLASESAAILDEFTSNACACGSRNSVIREFEHFLKSFPHDKNTPKIRNELLKARRSKDIRSNCHSG